MGAECRPGFVIGNGLGGRGVGGGFCVGQIDSCSGGCYGGPGVRRRAVVVMSKGVEAVRHNVVLTHTTADFDTLASAVGLARLRGNGTVVVLPGGEHPTVKRFLALHMQLLPVAPFQSIDPAKLEWVGVVDTHRKSRLGNAADWPEQANSCTIYDHHVRSFCNRYS